MALEQGFAAKPAGNPFAVPPIAQVASEAAAALDPAPVEERVTRAQEHADAETLRTARDQGRLIVQIPVSAIAVDSLTRDRMAVGREELEELKHSIRESGVRLPIEVFALSDVGDRYGLISGLRRVTAVRELEGPDATIPALIRSPKDTADAVVAMVEENEIRANLSHYERGRIAALAAGQGRFADVDEAIARLFAAASKAKRSKIRSFALVHEELGDMLSFPQELTERDGLRLANALRLGCEADLRAVLEKGLGTDGGSEWASLVPVIEAAEATASGEPSRRGGRPRKPPAKPPSAERRVFPLRGGAMIQMELDGADILLRLRGEAITADLVESIIAELGERLGGLA